MKYELYRKDFQKDKDDIYILPYIRIYRHDMIYNSENLSIYFGWIIWHGRFLWIAKENENERD